VNLRQASRKLFLQNVGLKKRERVLLVTDGNAPRLFKALYETVVELGARASVLKISADRRNSEPIPQARALFNAANVIIAPTAKSISHCPETRIARKRFGARVASMPGITEKLFLKAMTVNASRVRKACARLLKQLEYARTVRVKTASGTALTVRLGREKFKAEDGILNARGRLSNIPFGEVGAAPVENADGILTIDCWKKIIKPSNKAALQIKNGRIKEWNAAAAPFVNYLKKAGKNAMRIVEFSFGTNTFFKKPIGITLFDEKIAGTAHVAFGGWGNQRISRVHEDVVLLKPKAWIVKNKKLIPIKLGKKES